MGRIIVLTLFAVIVLGLVVWSRIARSREEKQKWTKK